MTRSPASRQALPHLAKLRARPDVGPGGLAAYGAVILAILLSTLLSDGARAETVRRVEVRETEAADVVVGIEASAAPTFQIFRVPGERTFAIELPGATLDAARLDAPKDGALLANARVDAGKGRGAPRIVLRFHGDVDYDARTKQGRLEVVFSPLDDPAKLKAAFAARAKQRDAPAAAGIDPRQLASLEEKARALTKQREAEEQALATLAKRKEELEQSVAVLEKRRTDAERARARDDDTRTASRAALEGREQELDRRVAALAEKERKLTDAVAALEARRARTETELAALADKQKEAAAALAAVATRRDAEQKKLAALEQRVANATKDLAQASKDREAALGRTLQDLEAQRAEAERKLAAAKTEEAALVQRLRALSAQVASLDEKRVSLEARVTELDRAQRTKAADVRALESRLASLEEGRKREETRLADAQRRAAAEAERLASLERRAREEAERVAALERRAKEAPTRQPAQPPAKPVRTARAEPRGGTVAGGNPPYGFGGNSIDLTPTNRYQLDEGGYEDGFGGGSDERGRGALSHVTVQRQSGQGSRVGVRVEGGARYAIERKSAREVVLTLFDTRAANLDVRRILDARDLRTSVLRVLPHVVEGSRNRVQLTIEMRDAFPVRVAQDDAMLWLHIGGDA